MPTIPNILSGLRLLIAPLLLVFAWRGQPSLFLVFFIIALITDAVDGWLARRLKQRTVLGSRLDSAGDLAIFLTVPLGAWWLWPDLLQRELIYVAVLLGSLLIPILLGFLKYRRLTSYHTWGAKTGAVALSVSLPVLFAGGPAWPFHGAVAIFALAELEEICITAMLPQWRADVPTFWQAVKIAHEGASPKETGT